MIKLGAKEKVLLVFLAVVILVFAYYMLVQKNVSDSLTAIESERSAVETEISIAQAKAVKMKQMQKELEQIEANSHKSLVPEYDNLSKEIVFLNEILDRTTDYTINFGGTVTSENIVRRTVSLEFTSGSYTECCQIIKRLQNCEYCCRVGGITMEPIQEYNSVYAARYGYTYDADYSILRNPLEVTVSATFFEKVVE